MPFFGVNYNASEIADKAPITNIKNEKFPAATFPFGCKVAFTLPPHAPGRAQGSDERAKFDGHAKLGIFAGYKMTNSHKWSGSYLAWDLRAFARCDLRQSSTWRNQKIGKPYESEKCQLPAEDGIVFPLKMEYKRINESLFGPLLNAPPEQWTCV